MSHFKTDGDGDYEYSSIVQADLTELGGSPLAKIL
jgi:hypothetical protein